MWRNHDGQSLKSDLPHVMSGALKVGDSHFCPEGFDVDQWWDIGAIMMPKGQSIAAEYDVGEEGNVKVVEFNLAVKTLLEGGNGAFAKVVGQPSLHAVGVDGSCDKRKQHHAANRL
jgi:hypothetical protein